MDFLYRQREIGVFVFLEIISIWLIVSYNQRPGSVFFNSSNSAAANLTLATNNVSNYFELNEINARLMRENTLLQAQLRKLHHTNLTAADTMGRFHVINAKVIANTFGRSANFLTITAGSKDGVAVGMGVTTTQGIVGQVKSVSGNFATVYSVLHPKLLISSKVKRTHTKGTVQWHQSDPYHASLKYIPRHIKLNLGDTVTTSGFNSVFPPNLLIGVIDDINLQDEMTFYEVNLKLATDFTSLDHVYVIKDLLKPELDSLELVF